MHNAPYIHPSHDSILECIAIEIRIVYFSKKIYEMMALITYVQKLVGGQGGSSFVDLLCFCSVLCLLCLCKPVLSGHTRRPNISFPDRLSLSEGFKYCRML